MKTIFNKRILSIAFFLIITAISSQPALSQSVLVEDFRNESRIGIELMVPSYSFTGDQRGVDFATNFYANIPISKTWLVNFSFPISRYDGGGSKLSSGNPFLGFHYFSPHTGFSLDFGARVPTIQQKPFGSYPPRQTFGVGTYNELKTAVRFNLHYKWNSESNWIYKVGQGLTGVAAADGPLALFLKFYGQAHYEVNDHFKIGAGLDGDLLTNKDHYLYPKRQRIQLGVFGSYDLGRVEIGAYMKDDILFVFNSKPNLVIGLNAAVSL